MLWLSLAATLGGAALAGVAFAAHPLDRVLLGLAFYGAWAALFGSYAGALVGAAVEEDACGELDMGVTSAMGAFLGAVAATLTIDALAGLALDRPWWWVWIGALAVTALLVPLERWCSRLVRRPGFDQRGQRRGARADEQPLRMRDRLTILVTLAVLTMLGLTAFMALRMGSNIGHPLMLAPMMYGMTGGMLGGIVGGWLGALRDEHRGAPEHESSVMVGAMGLMSGMMGAMPAGMTAGMLGVMGDYCIAVTAAAGGAMAVLTAMVMLWGRYQLGPVVIAAEDTNMTTNRTPPNQAPPSPTADPAASAAAVLRFEVRGMSCGNCSRHVRSSLLALPGVRDALVDHATGKVELHVGGGFAGLDAVARAVDEAGYELNTRTP
jgi:copper chaperone CopZ